MSGCSGPTFEVDLSTTRPGKKITIDLDVNTSGGEEIESLVFALPSKLKVKRPKGKKRRYGTASFTSASGKLESGLLLSKKASGKKLKSRKSKSKRTKSKKKRKALRFGTGAGTLSDFSARLFVKSKKSKKKKIRTRSGKLVAKRIQKRRFTPRNMPKDELTSASFTLNPDETSLIRLPKPRRCKKNKSLRFIAFVKTNKGRHVIGQKLSLKCPKKKKSSKKSKSKKKSKKKS